MMAKKLGSHHVVPLNHKTKNKLMKRVSDKKKRLFNSVLNYLKSDLFMFGPLLSSHSQLPGLRTTTTTTISSTSGVEANEPCIEEEEVVKKKELVRRKVGDYLKTDCYMYAPLVTPNPCLYAASNYDQHYSDSRRQDENTGEQSELLKEVSGDREKRDGKATTITNEDRQMKGDPPRRSSPILRHTTILHQETLKHVVHRKRISPSVPGKGSGASEARKPVARPRRL